MVEIPLYRAEIRLSMIRTPTTERVIMDPSHGYSSQVYDFTMRQAKRLPLPSDNDHAYELMDLSKLIERNELLNDVVGYRPLGHDSLLERGIKDMTSKRSDIDESVWSKLRARSMCDLGRGSGERHEVVKFYFGTLKDRAVWILLHAYDTESSRSGEIISCRTLDARAMSAAFHEYRHLAGERVGRQVLHGLKSNMQLELTRKRTKLASFEEVFASVTSVVELDRLASIPKSRD